MGNTPGNARNRAAKAPVFRPGEKHMGLMDCQGERAGLWRIGHNSVGANHLNAQAKKFICDVPF
jgi:hypothetical protein